MEVHPEQPAAGQVETSADIQDLDERAAEVIKENAVAREHSQAFLEASRERRPQVAYRLGRIDGLLQAAGVDRAPLRSTSTPPRRMSQSSRSGPSRELTQALRPVSKPKFNPFRK